MALQLDVISFNPAGHRTLRLTTIFVAQTQSGAAMGRALDAHPRFRAYGHQYVQIYNIAGQIPSNIWQVFTNFSAHCDPG